jgi:hypothetical protein
MIGNPAQVKISPIAGRPQTPQVLLEIFVSGKMGMLRLRKNV